LGEINSVLLPIIPLEPLTQERVNGLKKNECKQKLKEEAVKLYEMKEAEFPEAEQLRELERVILLKVIDRKWMDHIDDMDQLRQGIGLQAYGQKDPKVEYKMAAYDMFNEMISSIQQDTLRLLYHVRIEQKVEREQVAQGDGNQQGRQRPQETQTAYCRRRYIPMIPAPVEAVRNINSAAEEKRSKM
jgi:preprotein translocase subunit SecA